MKAKQKICPTCGEEKCNGKFRVIVYLSSKRSERKYVGYIEHLKDAVDLRNDFIKRNNLLEFNKINIYDGEKMHV